MEQNLYFNIIPFAWPNESITMFFHPDAEKYEQFKIHKSLFPKDIKSIINDITPQTEYIACSFTNPIEGFIPLEIDFQKENQDLIKRHFNNNINYYFRKIKEKVLKKTFIKENQVWLPLPSSTHKDYYVFEKFTLSINIQEVSEFPELQISYDGQSKVYKKSLFEVLEDVPTSFIKQVICNKKIIKYEYITDENEIDYEKTYPVLNFDLKLQLGLPFEEIPKGNKYIKFKTKIDKFYSDFLNNSTFKKFIPLRNEGFLEVAKASISKTSEESNNLVFGNRQGKPGFDKSPGTGIRYNGPYEKCKGSNISIFYIYHEEYKEISRELYKLIHTDNADFKGLYKYINLLHNVPKNSSIEFTSKENPLPEIEKALSEKDFIVGTKYFAIYVTPFSKYEHDPQIKEVYYKVKEALLKRKISSQVIDPSKIDLSDKETYRYSLPNIAIAILAKLGGVPWRLNTEHRNELVIGIGAFKDVRNGVQYVASAFSFENTGSFNSFEYFLKEDTDLLAGSIDNAIRNFTSVNREFDRLVIHFYKEMNEEEVKPIEATLNNLNLKIPVYIVTINKTESKDIIVFDKKWYNLMPFSGTFVNIGKNKYLLCNNTRYNGTAHKSSDGYPFPIKLKIDCTDKTKLQETKVIKDLIDQVYQFSRLYYKSIRQQNLPVTIKYPEMVAQIAPHFDGNGIPDYGKDNLWFI